jgi:uncharacterized protein (TIGR02145 family)
MAENLRTTRFNDGTPIPNVTDFSEWLNLSTPGYCWLNDDALSYKDIYGALYNWNAVSTSKLCPSGWHVPNDSEFSTLISYLGSNSGNKVAETGNTHWLSPAIGATNESGFTGLPGGILRLFENGVGFAGIGLFGDWWSATDKGGVFGGALTLYWDNYIFLTQSQQDKIMGFSVRCLKDN